MTTELETIFKSREIATFIWIALLLGGSLFSKNIRQSLFSVVKAFFAWKIQLIIVLSALYMSGVIYLLYESRFWNISMLKDSFLWFMVAAVIVLMRLSNAEKDKFFFRKLLLDNFKLTAVYQFIVNTHTFSLATEIILLPILILITTLSAYSEIKKEYQNVGLIMNSILILLGITFLIFAIIDITNDINKFASYKILKSFLLPIVLSFSFIPNAYFIALFMAYETLFTRLGFFIKGQKDLRYAKWIVIKSCHVRLSKIGFISPNVNKLYGDLTKQEIKRILNNSYCQQ